MELDDEKPTKEAKYKMGQVVEWRGTHYRIAGIYWWPVYRMFRYDLDEVMESGTGRFQKRRSEAELRSASEG